MDITKYTLEDGRKAEKHIHTDGDDVVTEIFCEEEKPLTLAKRVIEKKKPLIVERQIETIDANGDVVERQIEQLDGHTKMRLVDHLGVSDHFVQAQAVDDCDCHVTKDEMIEAIVAAIGATQKPVPKTAKKTDVKLLSVDDFEPTGNQMSKID